MKHPNRTKSAFLDWLREQASSLNEAGKFGTSRNYRRAYSSYASFAAESGAPSWPDSNTILKYSTWLQHRGIVRNTVSFYMRILRAAYNKAADTGLVIQQYPFTKVYTGVDRTKKRALDERMIVRILKMDLGADRILDLTRDMFIFSYCTRGMAFVDMIMLKRGNIRGNSIVYSRKKTGQILTIRIEDSIRRIMEKYRSSASDYIFPVLHQDSPASVYRQYQTALGYYNRNLKRLGKLAGTETGLSSYVARHSWASNARKHNIPLAVISAGMGHDSEKTTCVYLASVDSSCVDAANREILSSLDKAEGDWENFNQE